MMARFRMPGQERRDNLDELDPMLRDRLLALDEPVGRSDWGAVVKRSRGVRLSSRRTWALGIAAAGLAALGAAGATLGLALTNGGNPQSAASAVRLDVRLSPGSGLVLYSHAARQDQFVDSSDDRLRGRASVSLDRPAAAVPAAIERTLTVTGPFRVDRALLRAAGSLEGEADGPLPGDRALLAFTLFTTAGLDRRAGSAVLTCQYGFEHNAFCNAAFDLADGSRLTASGVLEPGAKNLTLVATGGSTGQDATERILRQPERGTT